MPCQAVVSERATKSVTVLRLGLPLLLLSILPGAGLPSNAWGQVNLRGRGDDQSLDQILLAPRPLTRLLREGKAAIEEKRYSDGISALGALLLEEERDDLPEDALRQDFFTEQGGEGYYRSSVRGEALRLLGSIPAEGRKTLEIQYGVAATRALDAAVAAADIEAISEVTRKYYHTNAGYDASVLLAQDKLIRGFPVAAASILQRLSEFPAARERFGAQLIGELASAWALARRLDLAAQALDQGAKLFPAASIVLGNRPTQLEPSQAWNRLLTEAFPEQSHIDQRFLADWLMTGGEAARNGTVNAGLPLPTLSWDMTLHRDRGDEEAVDNMAMRDGQSGSVLLPKLEARMTGNIVLAKTAAANIFAIDLDTGLRLWPFYKHLAPIELAPRATNMLPGELDELLAGADLRNRIWGSSAFGQFACDTNHLYYISSPDDQQFHQPQFFNPFARASSVTSYNYLTGVSLQDEGKVVWHIGGPDGESEPKLAGAYFLGPPLSFEGELYTLVEINGETRLAVLDAASGRLQWSQQLTQSPMSPIGRDRARQSQALSPSISDSIAVCPVGNGAIIAVDLLTRSLLWGKQYPTNTRDRNQLQMLNGLNDGMDAYEPTEERWQEPEVLIHKGQIVFTPPESNTIMCIDLLTGIPRWQQRRGMARYVAGIHNDRIVLVANTEVFALNLSDGRPSWGADITLSANAPSGSQTAGSPPTSKTRATMASRDRETVAGKSVRDGKNLYVPTSSRRVLKIDLDQGKLVDAASVEQPLGNLFAFRNRLISVSATRITAYYIRDALAEEVKQRLVANAQDTWALNQQALIHLADNQVKEAINLLRQSYAINATDGDTRFLLGSALLAGLEQDFDGYMALASELEPIIESQHFRFLVLLIKGNLRSGQYEIAFNRLLELMRERLRTKQPSLQTRGESVVLSAEHEVDVDSWIASQLGIAYERATPEAQQRMQALIAQRMQAITKSHPLTREMELQYLAWIPVAQPALLALADSLLGNTDQALGERLMQSILFSPDESLRRQAQTALARNSQFEDLAALSFLANDQFMLADDRPATMATQPLETQRAVLWPRGKVEETKLSKDAAFLHGQIRLKQVSNRYGRPNIEVGLASDGVTISNDSGQVLSRCEFERGAAEGADHFLRCQVDGGLVLLETQTELVAFDINRSRQAANDAILWRYSLSRAPQGPQTPFSAATHVPLNSPLGFQTFSRGSNLREAVVGPITPSGVLIQKESDLIMLNALSGAKLWRRTGYDDRTTLVRNGLEIAVMRPSVGKIDILDCRDGQLLKQLEYQGDWTTWFVSQAHVIQYAKLEAKQASGIQTEANSGSILRILNAFSGEVLLTKEFAPGCRADACSDRYIAVLDPKGQLWFCDAQSTKTAEHTTPVQAKLDRVRLQQFGQTLVLMTGTPLTRTGNVQVTTAADENAQTKGLYPINGHVFALSLAEGSLLWDRPATLSGFTFPSSQPRSAPFMACYRVIRNDRSHTAHVVLIDLRDGTPVYFNTNLPLKSSECEFAMELNPSRLAVQLSINAFQINLSMTDGDKPPQPVSYFGPISAQRSKPPVGKEFDLFNPAR